MITFLLKGLIRDRSRSIYPVLIVAAGSFLAVFMLCFLNGFRDDLIRSNAQFQTGHVKIMTRAYYDRVDQVPNDLALIGVSDLLAELRTQEKNMIWTPRIRFGGLLDIPDARGETRAQGPVMGLAVDLMSPHSKEISILNLREALVQGTFPQNKGEILVSDEFAQKLGLKIGETATLLGSTMNGAMAMYNFVVSGTLRFGITAMDRGAIIADINDVRLALDMEDGASEIFGFSKNMVYDQKKVEAVQKRFTTTFSKEDDEFAPIMLCLNQQNDLGPYLDMTGYALFMIVGIFVFVMSIVLWNSGLMNGLRRYGEIGIRLAMGEPKGTVYWRMIFESVLTAIAGSLIGTCLGLAISYYIQVTGIDFSEIMQKSSMMLSSVVHTRVTGGSFFVGFLPGLLASVVGTMFAGIGIYRRQTSELFKELEV